MTEHEWDLCKERLCSYRQSVKLKIDGYIVNLYVVTVKELNQEIIVLINGKLEMKWALEDCEIRRRFFNKRKKMLISRSEKKQIDKLSKKAREEILKHSYYYWYEPYWQSFRSLKLHFIKNNDSIELIDDDIFAI